MPTKVSPFSTVDKTKMPDSPSPSPVQLAQASVASSPNTSHTVSGLDNRVITSSSIINGNHSTSPSRALSPGLMNGSQIPQTCGARQLSKLKRFLTTLQQFGTDISPEIGERVRSLIVNLVNNAISVEEFHQQLQDATNFPLRPFVIPFLKANLPLLQQELLQCSQMSKQSPHQFHPQHDAMLFERDRLHYDAEEFGHMEKRKLEAERPKENGLPPELGLSPSKRACPAPSSDADGSILAERLMESIKQDSDEWRNVDTMLQCVMSIIDKAKRSVSALQERCLRDREEMAAWARRMADEAEAEVKRRAADLMTKTLKQTEDRIAEAMRRAEDAVSDVKRQAVIELQKAVCSAEEKANEALAQAHQRMEKAVIEARRQATEETLALVNHQENSRENCWNCGRKANETCSGCNVARYCAAFCQHKDWENHYRDCCKQQQQSNGTAAGGASSGSQAAQESTDRASKSPRSSPASDKRDGSPRPVSRGSSSADNNSTTATNENSTSADPISSLSDYVKKTPVS